MEGRKRRQDLRRPRSLSGSRGWLVFPFLLATPETQTCIVHPLLILLVVGRRLKPSLSLWLLFLSMRITHLLSVALLPLVYPISVLQNGLFGRGLFDRLCVWLLEFDALTTQV